MGFEEMFDVYAGTRAALHQFESERTRITTPGCREAKRGGGFLAAVGVIVFIIFIGVMIDIVKNFHY